MRKAVWILAVGLALLVTLLLMRERTQARATAPGYAFDTTRVAAVDRLHVRLQDDSVTLVRLGGTWRVLPDSFPADTARVHAALRNVLKLQDKEVVSVSTDAARLAEFGLYTGDRKRVAWSIDGRTETVYIGHTSGIDFNSTYWKHPDRVEVYRTPGNFTHEIAVHAGDWKDRTLFPRFEPEDIRTVRIRRHEAQGTSLDYEVSLDDDGTPHLRLTGTAETPGADTKVPAENVAAWFEALSRLTVDRIPVKEEAVVVSVPDETAASRTTVTVTLRSGDARELSWGDAGEEYTYLRHPVHHGVVGLHTFRLNDLVKDPAELLKPRAASPPDAEDVVYPFDGN